MGPVLGLNDMLKEAADIALHVFPPFFPLLSIIQYTQGDFFPIVYRPGRHAAGIC